MGCLGLGAHGKTHGSGKEEEITVIKLEMTRLNASTEEIPVIKSN